MPTNNLQALLSTDISDPTDFPTNELRQLDASLRCTICGEFYDAPVTLGCGHCFCSLHIVRETECPNCRKPTAEAHFRLNPVLEEAVEAPTVLRLWKEEQRHIDSYSHIDIQKTPTRTRLPNNNNTVKRKRRARSESSDSEIVYVAGPSNSKASSEVVDSSPAPVNSRRPSKRRDTEPSSDAGEEELERELASADSLIDCPICGRLVEYQLINRHIDGPDCRSGKAAPKSNAQAPNFGARDQWSKILGKGSSKKGKSKESSLARVDLSTRPGSDSGDVMERLPKASYAVLKDKVLRDLLLSQKLPTTGDRNTWIARHQRWVMMYNANLDKSEGNRKGLIELRNELKKWEEDRKISKKIVEDVVAHETAYRADFKRLVEEARRTRMTPATDSLSYVPQGPQDNYNHAIVDDSEED
ncbi:hypothetical protein EDC04DRAFT_2582702 [Pisolithus marmoratus]|nr:hypothetical protein EDC04DRAFT_2582702 [Pisolithus marmoratus]